MNFLSAALTRGGTAAQLEAGPLIGFADGARGGPDGMALTIGIRPEDVTTGGADLTLAVDLVEPLGSETLVHGRLPGGTAMTVKLPGGPPPGDSLGLGLPAAALHVFAADGGRRMEPLAVTALAGAGTGR